MSISVRPSTRGGPLAVQVPVRPLPGRVRWRRFVAVALGVVASLFVSYLFIANVLLRTRLLRTAISGASSTFAVSGNSPDLEFDYQSAYSLLPGRVHLEGVSIRGRDRTVEWRLTLDRADVAVSLTALLKRTFRATHLRASGFTIRARLRLNPADATPSVIAALPPIEGFADPPLLEIGPEPPPLTDADYNLWTLDFWEVDLDHVREVWIHTLRSKGNTRVRGRWLFRPQRWLDIGPAIVNANGADLSYGRQRLASGLHGSFGATVHPFDVRQVSGLAIFDHISYDGSVSGRAIVAGALRLLAPRSGVDFTHWETPFEARIVLTFGKLAAGTRVRTETTEAELETKGLTLAAPIRNEFGVAGGLATLDTRVSGLRVSKLGRELARVTSIGAAVTSRQLRLTRIFEDARFTLDVGGAETNDIANWRQFLPSTSPCEVRSGIVTARGHADGSLAEMRGRGAATIAADDVEVRLGRGVLNGKFAANVELVRGTWASRTFDLSGSSASLRAIAIRAEQSDVPVVVVPSFSAVAPSFTLAPSGTDGHVSIDLPRAELGELARLHELYPLPTGIRIERGAAQIGFHADIELGSGSVRGDSDLVLRGLRARVGSTRFFADVAATVRARRTGLAGETTDFSRSTLAISHASTGKVVPRADAWWGKLALREATLSTSEGVRFNAKVHVTAKDATPGTVLVAENTGVPSWAANMFRMPVLRADAEVRVRRSSLEVRSLVARGGGASLRAEYAKRGGRQDGAVLMDLGWIGLGYDLADGATGLVLIGPESWFKRKVVTLRNAAAAGKRTADAAEELARYAAMLPELRKGEASELARQCTLDGRTCDHGSIANLLRAAVDTGERDTLSGIVHAPLVIAAAKHGADGTTLDPLVVGSVAEALRMGGESTLDNVPSTTLVVASQDPDTARGKLIDVTGRISSIQREGSYSVGTLTTDAEPVHFVTPFAVRDAPDTSVHFRGVFVQRYAPASPSQSEPRSLVLVGAFRPLSPASATSTRSSGSTARLATPSPPAATVTTSSLAEAETMSPSRRR